MEPVVLPLKRSPVAMVLVPELKLVVVLAVEAPRSITRRLRLDHPQVAASVIVTAFEPHVAITTIIQAIVAGLIRPSISWTTRSKVDFGCSLQIV